MVSHTLRFPFLRLARYRDAVRDWMKRRWIVLMLISLACAFFFALLLLSQFKPVLLLEGSYGNFRTRHGRLTKPDPSLVFISLDRPNYSDMFWEDDLKAMSPEEKKAAALMSNGFPWPRSIWAMTIDRLVAAGAKVVVIDLLFLYPSEDDDALRKCLERNKDHVVIVSNIVEEPVIQGLRPTTAQLPAASILGHDPDSVDYWTDPRVGLANYYPDSVSGAIRSAVFFVRLDGDPTRRFAPVDQNDPPGTVYPSLATQVCRQLGLDSLIPKDVYLHPFRYSGPPGVTFPSYPFYGLFLPKMWQITFSNGAYFKDKIVLIGPFGNWNHDVQPTPFLEEMAGPEVHLNALSAILQGEFLYETDFAVDLLVVFLIGMLSWPVAYAIANYWFRLAAFGAISIVFFGISQLLYDHADLMVLTAIPLLAFNTAGIVGLVYDNVLERIERARVRHTLERYVSKNVVREILENPQGYYNTLGGVRAPVTILFSDVRGFTTMTESADPAQLVAQINEYMSEMVRLVFIHQGTLDKFIGDAVMAVWGNIRSEGPATDCRNAVQTALDMLRALDVLNPRFVEKGWPALHIGVGVNHGFAIVGNIGSDQKMEPTVLGDPVNLASRLESLTKEYGLAFLLGPQVAEMVREHFVLQPVDFVKVKGKTQPVEVFTCRYSNGEAQPENYRRYLETYLEALRLYRTRDFTAARTKFKEALTHLPDDTLARVYLGRSEELASNPPDDSWDGSYTMTKK
jgi:adenylate cyclase